MFTDRLDGDRIFARILAFEVACPKCGHVYRITLHTPIRTYNPRTGELACATCHAVYGVGVLLYPLTRRSGRSWDRHNPVHKAGVPADWSPNIREAIALRNHLAWGIYSKVPRVAKLARNFCLRRGCICDLTRVPIVTDDACPVHGRGDPARPPAAELAPDSGEPTGGDLISAAQAPSSESLPD